jgi:hypothetical protein
MSTGLENWNGFGGEKWLFTVEGVAAAGAVGPEVGVGSPEDGGSDTVDPEDLDVPDATFACPDLTTFCRVVEPDQWRRRCGCEGAPRDTVVRRLAHEPLWWRPTTLEVVVRRYRCNGLWARVAPRHLEGGGAAGEAVAPSTEVGAGRHRGPAPHGRRVAEGLEVAWDTANDAVLAEDKRVLIDDVHRFDGVNVVGLGEHVWRHTGRGDKYARRDHRPHRDPRRQRPGPAPRHG